MTRRILAYIFSIIMPLSISPPAMADDSLILGFPKSEVGDFDYRPKDLGSDYGGNGAGAIGDIPNPPSTRSTRKVDLQAVNDSSYVISKHPYQAAGYVWRAGAYSRLNMPEKSIADWSRAIKLEPHSASSCYVSRGFELEKLNRPDEALKDLDTAVKLANKHFYPYESRAELYLARGQFAKAVADFDKAIQLAEQILKKYPQSNTVEYLTQRRAYANKRLQSVSSNGRE